MEICNDCPCMCRPISPYCIQQYANIKDTSVLKSDHYNKTTDDIDTLVGMDCSDKFCEALKQAAVDAETNDNTIDNNLDQIWLDLKNDKNFKKWYANKILFHWLFGDSISRVEESGLVTTKNTDNDYQNQFEFTEEKERKRMQNSAKFYYEQAREKFLKGFWNKNAHRYPCFELECGCKMDYKCKLHCVKPRSIGTRIV